MLLLDSTCRIIRDKASQVRNGAKEVVGLPNGKPCKSAYPSRQESSPRIAALSHAEDLGEGKLRYKLPGNEDALRHLVQQLGPDECMIWAPPFLRECVDPCLHHLAELQ